MNWLTFQCCTSVQSRLSALFCLLIWWAYQTECSTPRRRTKSMPDPLYKWIHIWRIPRQIKIECSSCVCVCVCAMLFAVLVYIKYHNCHNCAQFKPVIIRDTWKNSVCDAGNPWARYERLLSKWLSLTCVLESLLTSFDVSNFFFFNSLFWLLFLFLVIGWWLFLFMTEIGKNNNKKHIQAFKECYMRYNI